jgi:hypothetical protein
MGRPSYSARALFDHAASILILAQSNKLRMFQMAAFRPFQEFNSHYGPILRGPSGKPLDLDNLSKAAGLEWHGWYSLRRGVATTLAGLTRNGMASKGLLRHPNLATTLGTM